MMNNPFILPRIVYFLMFFHVWALSAPAEENIHFQMARGSDIGKYVHEIIRLSDAFYSHYPYLYDGVQCDEEFYRRLYMQWPDARLVMVFDRDSAVGYVIGVPMKDIPVGHETLASLIEHGYDIDSLFLLGEITLLESYRGRGFGKKIVQQMEQFAKEEIGARKICLIQIDEDYVPASAPENYCPPDGFWLKQGYSPLRDCYCIFNWRNVDEKEESAHRLFYWIKQL